MTQMMGFLASADEVLKREDRPSAKLARVEFVTQDGTRRSFQPEFVAVVESILEALGNGKVVHLEAEEQLVSPERAAEMLGVTRPTIYAWQDRGRLARANQGNRRMVPVADIERYAREQQERAAWRAGIDTSEPDEAAVDAAAATFTGNLDLTKDATTTRPRRTRPKTRTA